jgi:hypothetical protein
MTANRPSLAKLKSNPAWASLPLFDRKGWKRVRFAPGKSSAISAAFSATVVQTTRRGPSARSSARAAAA